jgi:preprotein translocase subunit SecE
MEGFYSNLLRVCSSAGRASISKVDGRGFDSLRTRAVGYLRIKWEKWVDRLTVRMSDNSSKKGSSSGFVRKLKEELRKVSWTSKEELIVLTKIVVGASFVLGLGVYGVDLFIKEVLVGLGVLIHWIFG